MGVCALGAVSTVAHLANGLPGAAAPIALVLLHSFDGRDVARASESLTEVNVVLELTISVLWCPPTKADLRVREDRTAPVVGLAIALGLEELSVNQWLDG